jgi:hypothetical protein
MLAGFGFNFSQGLDDPLLFGLNKLMNFMVSDLYWCDNHDFAERHGNSCLRCSGTAPDMVRKWQRRQVIR